MLNSSERNPTIGPQDYIGWTMWSVGMFFEVVADGQKQWFKSDQANEGKFIRSGLWSRSRHPNYFGEILLWFGLYVSASSTFRGWQQLAVLCPVAVYLLITKISGIPLLEKAGMKKWGKTNEYLEYVKRTPVLVPLINY
eukprot:GHVH01004338.1.p1 GENE.GHVH01004338.1~~GHVH01004338.1.p1  ORF type:complete len:139 (+),score=20.07 GHVH01004338.1:469-885(+)